MRRSLISFAEVVLPFVVALAALASVLASGPFLQAVYLADRVLVFSPHPGTGKAQVKIALSRRRDALSVEFLEYQKEIVGHMVERK